MSINDIEGNVRPVQEILDELSGKWDSLSSAQQQNTAIGVAGQFQLSRFVALMSQYSIGLKVAETAESSRGSLIEENSKYLESYEAKLNRLSNAWTEFSLAVGGAFLNDGLTAGINALTDLAKVAGAVVNTVGVLPVVLGTVSTVVLMLSKNFRTLSSAMTFGAGTVSKAKLETIGLTAEMTRAQIATKMLSVSLKGLLLSTGVGVVFAGVGWAVEKLTQHYYDNKQAQEELDQTNKNFMQSFKENEKEVTNLANQFETLSKTINSGNYDNDSMTSYLEVQNELAELLPELKLGEDEYGNALVGSSEVVKSRIELAKERLAVEKELNEEKAKSDSKDIINNAEKDFNKGSKKQAKSISSAINDTNVGLTNYMPNNNADITLYAKELDSIDKLKVKIEDLQRARDKAKKNGDSKNDILAYDYAIDGLKEAIGKYGEYDNAAKKALLTIRDETLKNVETTLKGNEKISEDTKKTFSNILSSATMDASSPEALKSIREMAESFGSNGELQSSITEFSKESAKLSKATDKEFKDMRNSAETNFAKIKESILKDSGLEKGTGAYKSYAKSLDVATSSIISQEEASRRLSQEKGVSIDKAREMVMASGEEGGALEDVSSELDKQIEKLQEKSSIEENLTGVSKNHVVAVNEAIQAYNILTNATSMTKDQEGYLQQQMQLLIKLYPELSMRINGTAKQREEAIKMIAAENKANDLLLQGYALAADGKLSIEQKETLVKLEETNRRIKIINEEINALDVLQKNYADFINSRNSNAQHGADDLRAERFAVQAFNKAELKRASLVELTTSQSKYSTSLQSTIKAIGGTTSALDKGTKSKTKSNKETTKSIYTTDAYRKAMDKLTSSQKKQQSIMAKYPTYSKEYRKALLAQIKLKEREIALNNNQQASLKKQIRNKKIIVSGSGTIKKNEKLESSTTTTVTKGSGGNKKVVKTSKGKGSNKDRVWSFLKKNGYTDQAAAGVIGNLMQESGTSLNPRLAEFKGQGKIGGKGGFGILQWTGGRRRALEKFAKKQKKDVGDLDLQLAFFAKELNSKAVRYDFNKMIGGYSKLTKNKSVSSATKQFEKVMERASNKQMAKRIKYATSAYNSYAGKTITTVSKPKKETTKKKSTKKTSSPKTTSRALSGWNGRITSTQGKRRYKNYKGQWVTDTHNGVDIAAKGGTRLDSNVAGKVIASGSSTKNGYHSSYGNIVVVQDKKGDKHLYGHLQKSLVKIGDKISKGNAIGKIGSTGASTGNHLHYTVNQGGKQAMPLVKAARGKNKGVSSANGVNKGSGGGSYTGTSDIKTSITIKGRGDKSKEALDGARDTLRQLIDENIANRAEIAEYREMINDSYIESYDRSVSKREQRMSKRQSTKDRSNGTSKQYQKALKDDRSDINYMIGKTKQKRDFIKGTLKTKGLTPIEKAKLRDELDGISETLNKYTTDLMNNTAEEIERKHNAQRSNIEHQDLDISKEESYRETVSTTGSAYYSSIKRQEKDMASKEKALKADLKIAVSEAKNKKKNSAKIRREQDKLAESIRAELNAHKKATQELEQQRVDTKNVAREYEISKKDGAISQQSSLQGLMNTTSKAYNDSTSKQIQYTKEKRALLQSDLNYAVTQSKNMKLGSEGMKLQRQRAIEIRQQLIENSIALTELEKQKSDFKINKNDDKISDYDYLIQRSQKYSDSLLENDLGKAEQMGEQIALMRKKKDELVAKNALYLEEMKNKKLTAEQQKEYRKALQQNKLAIVDLETDIRGIYKSTADTMIDLYKQVYEKRKQLEMEAIEKERKNYQKLVNDKIEALNKLNQADDHKEDKSEYQKKIAELEKKINSYKGDDSKQGKYEKGKAEEELAELKKEYDKFMRDYETQNKIEEWQKDLENKEEELEDATKATDKYFENVLNDERKFNQMRQEILKGNVDTFKSELEGMGEFITGNMGGIGESISESILDQIKMAMENLGELNENMGNGNNNVTKPNGDVGSIGGSDVSTSTPDSSGASKNITTKKATKVYYTTDVKSKVLVTIPKGKSVPYSRLSSDKKWYEVTYAKQTGWVLKADLISTSTSTSKDQHGNTTKTTTTTNEFGTSSKSVTETNKEGTLGTTKKYDSSGKLVSTDYKQGKAKEKVAILAKADKTSKTIKTLAKDDKFDVMDVFSYYAKIDYKGFKGYIPKSKLIGLETGGYTGDNVPKAGGLALLHKKELVLNAKQTEHILNAVKLVDSFTNNMKPSNVANNTTNTTTENNLHIENLVSVDKFTGTETDIKKLTSEVEKNLMLSMKKLGMTRR